MIKKLIPFLIVILFASTFLVARQFPLVGATENSWTTKKAMPTARGGLGIAVVNGKIYAIGGSDNNIQLAVNEEYNPATDTWTTKTPMPTARSSFATAVYQNKIYCIGGTTGDSGNLDSGFTGVIEVYNPTTDKWETNKTPMSTPRANLCASVVNGTIYCIGGKRYSEVYPFYQELNVTEAYDPADDSWTKKSPMPIPVLGCTSAVLDGKIYVIGGSRHLQLGWDLTTVDSNQVYDPTNDAWSTRNSLPIAESYAAAEATSGVTAPKRIYVVGGCNETNYSGVSYAYDYNSNIWSTGTSMPTPRVYLTLAIVDDILYAIGGFDGEKWVNVNERYIPLGYGTVRPILQVLTPENKTYTSENIQLVISVNRETTWMGYSLDDQANVTLTDDTELFDMPEGAHSIVVYVNDTFGNMVSSSPVYFSVDTLPPRVVILFPVNSTYGESDIHSTFTVNEPVSWMGYSLDGQDNETVLGNVTLAVLADGPHNVIFYATDLVGNTGASEVVYFEIAHFPTVLVAAVAVTSTITVATAYLFLKRRKKITTKTQK